MLLGIRQGSDWSSRCEYIERKRRVRIAQESIMFNFHWRGRLYPLHNLPLDSQESPKPAPHDLRDFQPEHWHASVTRGEMWRQLGGPSHSEDEVEEDQQRVHSQRKEEDWTQSIGVAWA